MTTPLTVWRETEGRLLRLRLSRPKANLIDAEMIAALDRAFAEHGGNAHIAAILLDAEGPHFSFGASVEEHLPDQCAAMLAGLHGLVLRMVESPIPVLAAVRGQCLGGGLEVALAAHLMFVAADATLGQPEMKLGVFAPAASCLLPELIGPARALDLLVSGRNLSGADAAAILTDVFTRELSEGIGRTGIRPGIIKVATGLGQITRYERAVLEAAARAAVLLPRSAMTSGGGPMNVRPASRTARANASFSERKP